MTVADLSQTIAPKSDQLNADDLIAGPRVIKVTRVTTKRGSADQPTSIYFEGDDGKPYKPCLSMRRVLVQLWGADGEKYAGRSMRLYCDPNVTFGKDRVGGIRISHLSHISGEKTLALTVTRGSRKPFTVQPLGDAGAFTFRLRDSRGAVRETTSGDQWASALVGMLTKASSAAEVDVIWRANAEFIAEADGAGYGALADSVRAAANQIPAAPPAPSDSAGAHTPANGVAGRASTESPASEQPNEGAGTGVESADTADAAAGGSNSAPAPSTTDDDAYADALASLNQTLLDARTVLEVASVHGLFASDFANAPESVKAKVRASVEDAKARIREIDQAEDDDTFPGDKPMKGA